MEVEPSWQRAWYEIPRDNWQTFLAERVKPLSNRAHAVYEPASDIRMLVFDMPFDGENPESGIAHVASFTLTYPPLYRNFHAPNAEKEDYLEVLEKALLQVMPNLDSIMVETLIEGENERKANPPGRTDETTLHLPISPPAPERAEPVEHTAWLRFLSDEAVVLALLTGMHMVTGRAWLTVPWWRDDQIDAAKLCELAIGAHERGVDVRVLMRPLKPYDYGIDRSVQIDLITAGVPVRLHEHVHAKTFLLDDMAVSGSTNLTSTDFTRNPNDASLFTGPEIRRVESQFVARWGEAQPVET